MDLTSLTILLLALVGLAMVAISLWLLAVGRINLAGETAADALQADVSNFVTLKVRIPALGLMVLGILAIAGATQIAQQAEIAREARAAAQEQQRISAREKEEQQRILAQEREEQRRILAEAQAWLRIVGQVQPTDDASLSGTRLTLMRRFGHLVPEGDGSVQADVRISSNRYDLRVRSVGRPKLEAIVPIEQSPEDGRLKLPSVDLDELLGKVGIEKPAPAPTPTADLPSRDAEPSFGREQP